MTALLTDNLLLLTGAPNGIKNLHALIYELAVRGKLVPQDLSDEPASKLLKRIAEEKARLIAEGKLKKQKPLPEVSPEEKPYDVPAKWTWTRLGEITNFGATVKKNEIPDDAWVLDLEDIEKDSSKLLRKICFSERKSLSDKNSFSKGDVLYGKLRPYLNKVLVAEDDGFCTTEILPFRCHGSFVARYFMIAIKSPYFLSYVNSKSYGMKMPRLGTEDGRQALFPLPPVSEQHRIVAKVDELMALCDRMKTKVDDAETAHVQLVNVLLNSLTQASDATDFATSWQRLAEHFHSLFTTEPSIEALKKAVLQMAVKGKLVPQDGNNELADELFERITERKRCAGTDVEDPISAENSILPPGWIWVKGEDVAAFVDPHPSHRTPVEVPGGVPYVGYAEISFTHGINFEKARKVSPDIFREHKARYHLKEGDFVFGKIGTIGKPFFLSPPFSYCLSANLILIQPKLEYVIPRFLAIYFDSPYFLSILDRDKTNSTHAVFGIKKARNTNIPLPSLVEQKRIVAKVDQLIFLCDQLQSRLTHGRQLNEKLANTLVERALTEGETQAPISTDRRSARTLLAGEITHQLHTQRTFGQRKLQKVIYLAEHAARLEDIQGDYLRDAAGPHDRLLMKEVENGLQNQQWYERVERETVGHAYRPLSQAGLHRQVYCRTWPVAERATIEQVIELMRYWNTDRCEMTVTLYAAWNDFIIEGRPVSDEAIVNEVMHSWSDTKLRFDKVEWLALLADMKKHKILVPTGFGKRTKGGMLRLSGFEHTDDHLA